MSVIIRLSRQGAKKRPLYKVVVKSKSSRRDGGNLAVLGQYFPREESKQVKFTLNKEAFDAWVAKGAQVSQTVGQLVKTLAK